jgi:hypothetical protein
MLPDNFGHINYIGWKSLISALKIGNSKDPDAWKDLGENLPY